MTRQRRIAFLSEHASPLALLGGQDAGGQNVYVDSVARELGRLGFQVDVFTRSDRPDLSEIVELAPGVRVINIGAGPASYLPKDDLWPLMPWFRDGILDFIRRERIDYDLVHGNFWMSGWVAAELKRRLGIPAVQIFHAMGQTKQRHQGAADTSPAERIDIERQVVSDVDRLIAQCPSERDELIEDYGSDPAKIAVIPSAVNIDLFRPVDKPAARAKTGLARDEFVVMYVGRLLPRKDIRNVVRALAILQETADAPIRLVIVGGETREPNSIKTPEIGELRRLAAELGVAERVTFTGKRQQSELAGYYSAGDVVVTTPWYEPFGLTPLEAMACGRPVLGSAVGGITFTVQDGVTGFLVPPRDPEALAGKLRLLLNEPDLGERLGRQARERVETAFTWRLVGRRTADLYEQLLTSERYTAPDRLVAADLSGRQLITASHPRQRK